MYRHLKEILGESQVVFVNSDEFIEFNRPTSQKIIYIGGIGLDQMKKIKEDKDISRILDVSESVVLFSFGSSINSSLMPLELKRSFVEAFESFPNVTFIWRYVTPEDDFGKSIGNVKNVVLKKWLPQLQILSESYDFKIR